MLTIISVLQIKQVVNSIFCRLPVQAKVENELTGVFGPYQNEDNLTNDLSVDDLLMMLKELSKYSMPRSTWFSMSPQNPSSPQKQDLPMTDSNFE